MAGMREEEVIPTHQEQNTLFCFLSARIGPACRRDEEMNMR